VPLSVVLAAPSDPVVQNGTIDAAGNTASLGTVSHLYTSDGTVIKWNGGFDIGCLIAAGINCDNIIWYDAMSAMKHVYRSQFTDPPYEDAERYSFSLANAIKDCAREWRHYKEFLHIKNNPEGTMQYWLRRCQLDVEATWELGQMFVNMMTDKQKNSFLIEQEALVPAAASWIRGKLYDFEGSEELRLKLENERTEILIKLMGGGYIPFHLEAGKKCLASSSKCAELLYDIWKIPFYEEHCRTDKGGRSVAKKAMTFLIEKHIEQFPQLQLVKDYRGMKSKFDKFINGPINARKYLGEDYMHHQLRLNSTYTGRCTVTSKCKVRD